MTYLIVTLAVLARFIPHASNFSPVYGALLFGGAHLNKRHSVWLPICLLGMSDWALTKFVYHTHLGWTELVQLAAFAAIVLIGWSLRRRWTAGRFLTAVLAGPTAFYFISNFGVWVGFGLYPPTWHGLIACYVAGLPFYGNTLLSGVIFSVMLFGACELYRRRFHANQPHYSAAGNR